MQAGARVLVVSLGKEGTIESVEAGGEKANVRIGGLRMTVSVGDLAGAGRSGQGRSAVAREPRVRVRAETGGADVVVVGLRVEEALARVDKALDRALLGGSSGFRVVHGRGTGALRRAIREHLSGDPHVTAVRPVEGNDAATWVELS